MTKLTEKQKRFIDYYIETGNATEACRLAGYRGSNLKVVGKQNLTKLNFYIQEKMAAKDNQRIASQDEVLRYLTSVLRGEADEENIVIEAVGDYCTQARIMKKKAAVKDRNDAAKQLLKITGVTKIDREKLDIEKEKLIIMQTKSGQADTTIEDDGFLDALKGKAKEVWADDSEED